VAAEGSHVSARPDKKEVKVKEGLSGISSFKGASIDFQSTLAPLRKDNAFKAISASSSNEEKFNIVAEDFAAVGSYEIEISQLAQSQKLKSQSFESEFENIGSGTLVVEFGEVNRQTNSFDLNTDIPAKRIVINQDNSSLRDIQIAINAASAGVSASIINDGGGNRLIFNSEKTGTENSLRISVLDDDTKNKDLDGLSVLTYDPVAIADDTAEVSTASGKNLEVVADAKNALFSIDGISISNGQNTIKDNIPGITLELKKTTDDGFETFKIEKETTGIKQSIESFVAGYNETDSIANSLTGFNAETARAGTLSCDASTGCILNHLRTLSVDLFM